MVDSSSGPEIKIGTGKQNAVKAIIMGCTPASYKAMVTHMSLMSDFGFEVTIIVFFYVSHTMLLVLFLKCFSELSDALRKAAELPSLMPFCLGSIFTLDQLLQKANFQTRLRKLLVVQLPQQLPR